MKALVVTNCATAAYTAGLRVLFPRWEVKGANIDVALTWLGKEPNEVFRTFLGACDLLLLGTDNEHEFAGYAERKEVLSIPYFYFRALHPDCFHLGIGDRAVPSVLRTGNLHSRLAVGAFLLGLPRTETVAAFNANTYGRLGYLSLFEEERRHLLARFAEAGIDLAPSFERWYESGDFLYTANHPKAVVFNDILCEALAGRFLDERARRSAPAALAALPDFLDPAIRWPIYPEIALRHGMKTDFLWRTGVNAGPVSMTLDDFVAQTFDVLTANPALNADCLAEFDRVRAALLAP